MPVTATSIIVWVNVAVTVAQAVPVVIDAAKKARPVAVRVGRAAKPVAGAVARKLREKKAPPSREWPEPTAFLE